MRLFVVRACVVLSGVVFGVTSLLAQADGDVSLRYRLSYGKAWFNGTIPTFSLTVDNCKCPNYTAYIGTYASQSIGAGLSFMSVMHVSIDVGVQSMTATSLVPGDTLPSLDSDGRVVLTSAEFSGVISIFDAFVRPSVGVVLPLGLSLEAGAIVLFNTNNYVSSVIRLVSPKDATFDKSTYPPGQYFEDNRAILIYKEDLIDFPKMRVDIDASVGKSFTFSDFTIQFLAKYQFGLMELTTQQSLRSSALAGTLAFLYRL